MELTRSNKSKETAARNWLRQPLTKFVNRHGGVFEALARTATPFGGNWLSADRAERRSHRIEITREQLQNLQQQLDVLNETVAKLSDQLDAQSAASKHTHQSTGVGINRFRALQTQF